MTLHLTHIQQEWQDLAKQLTHITPFAFSAEQLVTLRDCGQDYANIIAVTPLPIAQFKISTVREVAHLARQFSRTEAIESTDFIESKDKRVHQVLHIIQEFRQDIGKINKCLFGRRVTRGDIEIGRFKTPRLCTLHTDINGTHTQPSSPVYTARLLALPTEAVVGHAHHTADPTMRSLIECASQDYNEIPEIKDMTKAWTQNPNLYPAYPETLERGRIQQELLAEKAKQVLRERSILQALPLNTVILMLTKHTLHCSHPVPSKGCDSAFMRVWTMPQL
jgi:hypothetical protein